MITRGHHTCRKDGGTDFVLKNAPFLAIHSPDGNALQPARLQFLGQGYYFWDNNIEMAMLWGKHHYNNDYFIIESKISITEKNCFDLVGNREHMILLTELITWLKSRGHDKSNWEISKCIEFLKQTGMFKFKCIRAVDHLPPKEYIQEAYAFVENNKHFTVLNPKIAICMLKMHGLPLQTKKLVYES